MKKIVLIILVLICLGLGFNAWHHKSPKKLLTTPKTTTKPIAMFDKSQYSTTDPTSIWVVVNKQHPIQPVDYQPSDLIVPSVPLRVPGNESMKLRAEPAAALERMFTDAKSQGVNLMLSSGYRSYAYQVNLYGSYVKTQGKAGADSISARPGYSEHQTGFAADIEPLSQKCDVDACFGDLPEGKWLADNAYKYGFIVRYTKNNQDLTGYSPEPWHIRYIGNSLAKELHDTGTDTLEKFFNITGGPNY